MLKKHFRNFLFAAIIVAGFIALLTNASQAAAKEHISSGGQLPFPDYKIVQTDSALNNGYFLMAPFRMTMTAHKSTSTLMIISGKGHVVYAKPDVTASDFKVQPNGMLTYYNSRCFVVMNPELNIVDSVSCVDGATTDSHDFVILPNGNYVLIGMRSEIRDFSSYEISTPKKWKGGKKTKANYGIVQILSADKKLLYEWSSKGQYDISDFDPVYLNDTNKLDMPHFNSVVVDSLGNFLLSARYTNEVIYVNKVSGKIEWRLGGNRSTFRVTGEPYPFYGQHDARFQPDGNVILFDNGYTIQERVHPARSAEYHLDFTSHTATCVWSWSWGSQLVSEATGTTQRLPNGYALLNFGKIQFMSQNILCAVANRDKNTVFQIAFADTMGSYSTHYYSELPAHIARPEIQASRKKGIVHLTIASGDSCIWNNGSSGSSIVVTTPGSYQAFLRRPDGSYFGSDPVEVTEQFLNGKRNRRSK